MRAWLNARNSWRGMPCIVTAAGKPLRTAAKPYSELVGRDGIRADAFKTLAQGSHSRDTAQRLAAPTRQLDGMHGQRALAAHHGRGLTTGRRRHVAHHVQIRSGCHQAGRQVTTDRPDATGRRYIVVGVMAEEG